MALISPPCSPHCIRTEKIQCKRHNGVGIFSNTTQTAKSKQMVLGLTQRWSLDGSGVGQRRNHRVTVAASPPTEDAVVAAEPLTKDDLVSYLASGCKPRENWRVLFWALIGRFVLKMEWHLILLYILGIYRIGTEHEKFGFELKTLRPMKYEQIAELLNGISERFDWGKIMEGDNIIGLKQGNQSISLEPGGQFELSGAPVETLHQTCAEVNSHLYQVKAVAEEMGIGFLGIGFQPKWKREEIPVMPKGRYEIMKNYMPKVGSLGLDMMFRTCTVQVNLDFDSERDMIRKFRAGLALQPIATALFANSPFTEGKPNGYLSMRSQIWTDTDNNRSGMLPFVFDDSFGFEQYVKYALDVPMYFVYRKKKYINCTGMSFRDFMAGNLPCLPGEYPNLNDWENHLTTIFPEVRLKRYLEMRGADGGPWRRLCALPAFWVGVLYDDVSLQNVLDMTADWTPEERQMLRNRVPMSGLKTPFRDGLLKHVAQDVVKLAKDGLERRGFKETGFLNEVTEVVNSGVTPAERLLELYHGKWGQNVDPVFEELLY
ncbi:glutamate--cysteine ligase [Castilleja foliolosa]|uniref:Glutamate--cysteine ligase, chloroplastic n=1 Tax=Castilleja foliolosa TaxID=1961234 RepID=A0ABD3BPV4_9LAMI